MAEVVSKVQKVSYVDLPARQAVRATLVGAASGIAAWALAKAFLAFLFDRVLCTSADSVGSCANAGSYANITAAVLVAVASVYFLVRFGIYRPLVVVLAAMLALWPILVASATLPVAPAIVVSGLMFAIGYLAFTWLVRIRPVWLSIILALAVVLLTRLVLGS